MTARLFVLSAVFVATSAYGVYAMRPEQVPPRESLSNMPQVIGRWQGRSTEPFSAEIMKELGVDEYVSRFYVAPAEVPVSLYLGYYESQRQGDAIHSPINCLPGAGWEPMVMARTSISITGRPEPITVNRFLIQKGLDRQVVLYWYQSHGRVVASEYWSKVYMVFDAVRFNRSDAALVRVMSGVASAEQDDTAAARRATEFVQAMFPQLGRFLPS